MAGVSGLVPAGIALVTSDVPADLKLLHHEVSQGSLIGEALVRSPEDEGAQTFRRLASGYLGRPFPGRQGS